MSLSQCVFAFGAFGGLVMTLRPASTKTAFEHDQGIQACEVDGVHMQEVDGDDALGLVGQELLPCRTVTARGGVDPGLLQSVPDGGGGDRVAEAGPFTMDTPVTPARVLRGHAQDKCLDRSRTRYTVLARSSNPLAVK
ncbi:hypothetical protein ACWDRB_41635 [Nonomuraea sp. NPDC003707]